MQAKELHQTDLETRASGPIGWAEMGLLPDRVIRAGIRRLNKQRLEEIRADDLERAAADLNEFVARMHTSPIAPVPELANEQHYEVPAAFFDEALGTHRKYSCCHWTPATQSLDEAEAEALRITCERAGIEDGMSVLDLGCGWGSLSLWIAAHYPNCQITSVSNSASQREHIINEARERGLNNVTVLTRDMNEFNSAEQFDRVVSVEMFEHMRNYPELFRRVSSWLKPRGRFFMHIFCHRTCAYEFVDSGPSDWMSRHFFAGGIMPSDDLPTRFQSDLGLLRQWRWDGRHYERTANAWLENMDARKSRIMPLFTETYGAEQAEKWFMRWRIFFMACAELFAHDRGQEWYVSHYLFERAQESRARVQA
jgi:cyclopropane-fatty-acyl-phospholipid synthase